MKKDVNTKRFWLMLYAIDSFTCAASACKYILEKNLHPSELMFRWLCITIYTLYGRPFRKSQGVGKLEEEIVPDEYRDIHEKLVHERDKVHAHIDAYGITTHIGNANQIRLLRAEGGFKWCTSTFLPDFDEIQEIQKLCNALAKKLDSITDEFESDCLNKIRELEKGEYIVRIDQSSPNLFDKVPNVLPPNNELDLNPI